jgi:type IX secretion system PorP/SprF family membrane protein
MSRQGICVLFFLITVCGFSQQLPYFTQFRANSNYFNPAVTGTRRTLDMRVFHRNQWVGYEGQPRTQGFNLNSRLMKGKMGLGFLYYNDVTGPTMRNISNINYSFHIRYPDIEFSMGLSGNIISYHVLGSRITTAQSQDLAINNKINARGRRFDMSAGALLYNDRFHIGLSILNMLGSTIHVFEGDSLRQTAIGMVGHPFFSIGYNFSGNPDFVWENTLQGNYVSGSSIMVDYSLRVFIRNKMFGGVSYRIRDAAALHAGVVINDFGLSSLRKGHANSHEITLVWSSNLEKILGRKGNSEFRKQKFQYLL